MISKIKIRNETNKDTPVITEVTAAAFQTLEISNTLAGFVHEGVPTEVFLALSFDGKTPQGTVLFHDGFKAG